MKITELKKDAIAKLSGKWGKAVGIYLVVTILSFVLTLIPSLAGAGFFAFILNLLISILSAIFTYGLLVSMIKLSRSEDVAIMDFVTIGLKNIVKIIKVYLLTIVKLWLPILLYLVGCFTLGVASVLIVTGETAALTLLIASLVVCLIASILFIVKSLLYSLSFYLMHDNPEATTNELLNKSAELMKGYRVKYILTEFSFLGWLLLVIVATLLSTAILPILAPFLVLAGTMILSPYMSFTLINFYEKVAGINDVKVENV